MRTRRLSLWGVAVFLCCVVMIGQVQAQETPEPDAQMPSEPVVQVSPAGATPTVGATPTIDRLAAPPTVASPNQADEGAQLFWLYCQPCHGDQGQGLTDEWREQFPEEEQYCWQSGCHSEHGKDLPEYGFVLPTSVPGVNGDGDLGKFETTQALYSYIRAAMPYEAPGRLTDAEYLAITAFIARAHGVWDGAPLNETNAAQVRLRPMAKSEPAATESEAAATEPAVISGEVESSGSQSGVVTASILTAGMALVFLVGGGVWLWRRREG